jgi:hypothetical protein
MAVGTDPSGVDCLITDSDSDGELLSSCNLRTKDTTNSLVSDVISMPCAFVMSKHSQYISVLTLIIEARRLMQNLSEVFKYSFPFFSSFLPSFVLTPLSFIVYVFLIYVQRFDSRTDIDELSRPLAHNSDWGSNLVVGLDHLSSLCFGTVCHSF